MRRIHITGASGSGTSTLGRSVAELLSLTFLDADHYFWLPTTPPFQERRPKPDRIAMIRSDIEASDGFVLSGSICRWDRELEDSFDLIVFLSIPNAIRLERLRRREIQRYGSVNREFIDWASLYEDGGLDVRSRALHEWWLGERSCRILRLEGDLTNHQRLEEVKKAAQPGATDNPGNVQ
jgi:adenylate kinase family enzyme